jgi:hypothetical protein
MTYTLIVYMLLAFGPSRGYFDKVEVVMPDYTTCRRMADAINTKESPHHAVCKIDK